jgi:hypothetical protein
MQEDLVKSSEEYVDGNIKLTVRVRVWHQSIHGYVLVVKDKGFLERFRALGGDKKRVLVEVDTPIARFIYATYGDIMRKKEHGRVREYVKFHCPRDFDETWKALYWFGDFTINVYIPYVNHSVKSTRGGR